MFPRNTSLVQEIVPHLTRAIHGDTPLSLAGQPAMRVNGNGLLAREWASILERLTKRSDLHFLTLQWWVGDLPPHKLLREKPAWCPACYAEWKDQGMPIYEPLLWIFPTVTICLKHLCKLEEYCPGCEKRQSFIRFQTALDQCPRCKTWLGSPTPALVPRSPEIIEWQRWVIHALEELRCAAVASAFPPWEQFFTNLSRSCEGKAEQSRLARTGWAGTRATRHLVTPIPYAHPGKYPGVVLCVQCDPSPDSLRRPCSAQTGHSRGQALSPPSCSASFIVR